MSDPVVFQRLRPLLGELARFDNTKHLERSGLYRKVKPDFDRVLSTVWQEESTLPSGFNSQSILAVAWNIERGIHIDSIIGFLRQHPSLITADLLLLSELDLGMARTGNRFVAREIAAALGMSYAFAPCYVALNKGA